MENKEDMLLEIDDFEDILPTEVDTDFNELWSDILSGDEGALALTDNFDELLVDEFDGVSPFNMFVYDIGWAVVDKKGTVYETKSYINRDIFMEEKDLMFKAFIGKVEEFDYVKRGGETTKERRSTS